MEGGKGGKGDGASNAPVCVPPGLQFKRRKHETFEGGLALRGKSDDRRAPRQPFLPLSLRRKEINKGERGGGASLADCCLPIWSNESKVMNSAPVHDDTRPGQALRGIARSLARSLFPPARGRGSRNVGR